MYCFFYLQICYFNFNFQKIFIAIFLRIFAIQFLIIEKNKLIEICTLRGFSQKQVVDHHFMDASNYNCREKGKSKIASNEFGKLARILEVLIEDIFENDDSMVFICRDNATGNYQGNDSIYSTPEFMLESQRKYLLKLESENKNFLMKTFFLKQHKK